MPNLSQIFAKKGLVDAQVLLWLAIENVKFFGILRLDAYENNLSVLVSLIFLQISVVRSFTCFQ